VVTRDPRRAIHRRRRSSRDGVATAVTSVKAVARAFNRDELIVVVVDELDERAAGERRIGRAVLAGVEVDARSRAAYPRGA